MISTYYRKCTSLTSNNTPCKRKATSFSVYCTVHIQPHKRTNPLLIPKATTKRSKNYKKFRAELALVAQGIEQRTSNPQVVGSIPTQGAPVQTQNNH